MPSVDGEEMEAQEVLTLRHGVMLAAVLGAVAGNTYLLVVDHATVWVILFGLAAPLVGVAEWLRARGLGVEARRLADRMLGVVILGLLATTALVTESRPMEAPSWTR
jgi:hypothetical protein